MKTLYYGSFDPFTNGHLNVLKHASKISDKVIVVMTNNPNKKRFTDCRKMSNAIISTIKNEFDNVEFMESKLPIYKIAKQQNCDYLVRGIRNNGLDYSYEENIAEFYKEVGHIDTIYIRADVNKNVSSTMIRTLINAGDIDLVSQYVPSSIFEVLYDNWNNR